MSIDCHACIGGTSVREDMTALQAGPQVVVGTPGRVQDMIQRRYLKTDAMKMFVLDEADEMLSVCLCCFPHCYHFTYNTLARFHGANLRYFPASSAVYPGRSSLRHYAPRCPRGYHQVHAGSCPYPG